MNVPQSSSTWLLLPWPELSPECYSLVLYNYGMVMFPSSEYGKYLLFKGVYIIKIILLNYFALVY